MNEEIPTSVRTAAQHGAVRDASRLINFGDILYQLGTLLYRKSLRYTALTAGIAFLGYFSSFAGLPGFSGKQALVLPLIVGGVTLLSGVLLRVIPAVIASRQMMVAQANDMNLMEDYRKGEVEAHLEDLWDRVYRYEYRLAEQMAGREPDWQAGKEAFFDLANLALNSHLSQPREYFELGIDLHHYEDWLDGAYFDPSDIKLLEQYEGDSGITSVKRWAGFGMFDALLQMPIRFAQRAWLSLITRAVAIHVADAVDSLNRTHRTDVFNAQVLIWPGEETASWFEQFPGAREEVLERRKKLMLRVFGADRATARNMLDRMFAPNFELATELRTRFDPEYCLGGLRYDVSSDLDNAEFLQDRRLKRRAKRRVDQSKQDLEVFDDHLAQAHPSLSEPQRTEELRAVRIAYHTDRRGLKRRFLAVQTESSSARAPAPAPATAPANEALLAISTELVEIATKDAECYSRRLLSLRQHHELTRLERLGYYRLVDALWPE